MAGKYLTYSKYRASGNEWISDLPEHWQVKRNKTVFKMVKTPVGKNSGEYQLLSLTLNGIVPRDIESGKGKIPAEFDTYQEVKPNDIVFCLFDMDETPRTVGLSSLDGMITGAYDVVRCFRGVVPEYIYYYYLHVDSYKGLRPFYTGLRKVVRPPTFLNIEMPVPSSEEQLAITRFLDHETAKIDCLIEKQQRLIELLKEKRQAVISHAVTKGLEPNVTMKDSRVEWLGQVPEHWVVSRIGFCATKIGSGKTPKGGSETYKDEGVLFLRSQNIYDSGLRIAQSDCVYISNSVHNEMKSTAVKGGDVLLNITGGSIGRTCLVPEQFVEANVNQHVCILRFPRHQREFLSYVMKSNLIKTQIDIVQVGGNREGLNFEQIGKMVICIAPESERIDIVEFIKTKNKEYDDLEGKALRAIELMEERRTALISAAVTGKIDVRNWHADKQSAA